MEEELKIVVMNPPSEEHLDELCKEVIQLIQENY